MYAHLASYPMGNGGPFPLGGGGLKWLGCQANPSSAYVKNAWRYTFTPPYAFVAWCFVRNRDNFIFTSLNI